jgi:LCP family protein required for cell wall assembly
VAVMEENKEKKSSGAKRVVITIVCIILALILVLTACVGAYVSYLLGKIDRVTNEQTIDPDKLDQIIGSDPDLSPLDPSESLPNLDDITIPSEGKDPSKNPDHVINILLIGQDETIPGVRARSDSMILVTVNTRAKSVTFISFMRDSYVQIPGYASNKLNHAYQYGGMRLLNETLNVNFGVEVDGDIEINFSQFKDIIDLLGGVEISLTNKEAFYMNHLTNWNLKVGKNRLTGEQALVYARLREIDSDYQRTERQRTVMMALVNAYKNLNADEMMKLLEAVLERITTNMSDAQIWEYALKTIPILAGASYGSQRLPVDGSFSQGNIQVRPGLKGWFIYRIDFNANRKIMEKIFE